MRDISSDPPTMVLSGLGRFAIAVFADHALTEKSLVKRRKRSLVTELAGFGRSSEFEKGYVLFYREIKAPEVGMWLFGQQ